MIGRVCLARPPAPPGFRNLLALSSAPSLPALFRAGSAHGVPPSRAFLLSCSRTPSPAPLPSWRWSKVIEESRPPNRANPKKHSRSTSGKPCPTTSPSGFCSTRESATYPRLFRPSAARSSPGLSPSRVFTLTGMARLSPRLPSWAWLNRSHATGRAALQGLASSEIGSSLSRPPTLLGFLAS
jgi:hypothetical protein